jgi:8-oxo-dGTP diphosphatase
MTNEDRRARQAALPKKRMAAGALFLDEQGRILLVNPTYKPQWEIPGGIVEENESPRQACIREVQEEIGLQRSIARLLSVSYIPGSQTTLEGLMFIFWGGVLTPAEIAQIRLPTEELSEYEFCEITAELSRLTPTLRERVRQSLTVVQSTQTLYLEQD